MPYRKVFERASAAVDEAQKIGVTNFKVERTNINRDYFIEAIDLMKITENQLGKPEIFSKEKALAFYCMGNLDFQNKKIDDSIDECLNSIKLEPDPINNKETYNLINAICSINSVLIGKVKNDVRIIVQLFTINDALFDWTLNNLQQIIVNFMNKNINEVKYLMNLEFILTNQKSLADVKTYKEINILEKVIIEIYKHSGEEAQIIKFQQFFNYFKIICEIYVLQESAKSNESLKKWLLKLAQIDIETVLFNKIQSFSIPKLLEAKVPIQEYEFFINLSKSDKIKNKAGVLFGQDPGVLNVRIQAYETLAGQFLVIKEFGKSLENYLKALEGNPKSEISLRKLDELYFLQLNSFNLALIPLEIKNTLLAFNITEFVRVFKVCIIEVLNDFKLKNGARKLFRFYEENKDFSMIFYLQDFKRIFAIFSKISEIKSYEPLSEIYDVFKCQIKEPEVTQFNKKTPCTICENILQSQTTLLRIDGMIIQYQYLMKLAQNNKDLLKSCFEESANNFFYGNKDTNDQFLEQNISNFELNEQLKDVDYYEKVLGLVGGYVKNMKCMALASNAFFRIGEIKDDLGCYEKAINFDKILRDLSKVDDDSKKFCAKNSKIRRIYNNMAFHYKKRGNLGKALEFFELRGNHQEIQYIIKEILKTNESNPTVLEKIGDYYVTKGMDVTALDYYHQVYGLIDDQTKMGEIMGKEVRAACIIGEKGNKTQSFIEKQQILQQGFDLEFEGGKVFKDWKI